MVSEDEDTPEANPRPPGRWQPLVDDSTRRVEKPPSTGFGTLARSYRDVGPYLGLGIQLAATIVICFFIGRWLDDVFSTTPWLMVLGALLGAGAGLYNFLKTVIELGKRQKEKEKREENTRR